LFCFIFAGVNLAGYKNNAKTSLSIVKRLILTILITAFHLSLFAQTDTTAKKKIQLSKDSVDAIISYTAADSGVMLLKSKTFFLYGNAKTTYKTAQLEAGKIIFDQETQNITAYGAKDTSGNLKSKPRFKEGDLNSINDSIFYNLQSGKGLIKNSNFQQGEIFVQANALKKVNPTDAFAWKARFTTCNLDEPHFAFRTNKLKIVTNKIGVSGPAFPEFEGVPMPVGIPFGIFPLNKTGGQSGLMAPAFSSSEDFGLGFEGLGYYKVINQHMDATLRGNIYSYGGWNLNMNSKYIQRYKYIGNFNLSLQNTRALNRNTQIADEFTGGRTYMLNWSHTMDSKARPGTTFAANVNFGSTKYNRNLLNNVTQNFQNQISSSVAYSKSWNNKYNLSVNLTHNQNNNLGLVNMSLPNINFNALTVYPFQSKDQIGAGKWYEKIGIGYNGSVQNQLSFYDSSFSVRRILDTMQWGANHSIPITLSLPSLGPITIAPNISLDEKWFGQQNIKTWNSTLQKVDTTINKGFYRATQMSFGLGTATRIFGTYKFKKGNLKAIRHEIRPSVSLNYKPDMAKSYHYATQVDTSGRTYRFSKYDGNGLGGAFSEGSFGGLGFGVDNFLEMKVKNKQDTSADAFKKIKLIEGFGFNSSYNFLADSFALGGFNLYARTTLFEKLSITTSFNIDPYESDIKGFRVNKLAIDPTRLKFGSITNGALSFSTSFTSKTKNNDKDKKNIPLDPFMTPDEQQRQLSYVRANPAEFTDFNTPWSLTMSYSFQFSKTIKPDYSGFKLQTFSTLNLNGDFSISPKWKVGGSSYVDLSKFSVQQLSMFITREMHCWQLAINVMPIGIYRSFSITVNPKSGILRDLKINRSRTFSNSTY
jgi:LPS-assembly protein